MDPILVAMAVVVCARLAQLGALALRLRARARYQSRQHDTLMTLALRLQPTMVLELHDPHGDGTLLRLRTGGTEVDERGPDARA